MSITPDPGIDLDLSGLTADDANELRALFTTSATASRKAGRMPQEGFLISLAGMMDGYLARLTEEDGGIPTEEAEYESARAVDLTRLSGEEMLRGTRALIAMGQAFEEDGRPDLAGVFQGLAAAFADAFQRQATKARHNSPYGDQ